MPNIHIRIPKGSLTGAARADLVRRINDAAANAEQIPAEPRKRMLCWVLIDEVADGALTPDGHPNSPIYGHLKLPHLS